VGKGKWGIFLKIFLELNLIVFAVNGFGTKYGRFHRGS